MNCKNRTFAVLNQQHFLFNAEQLIPEQNHRGNWVLALIQDMLA
jgi:hypothetical protein